MLKGWIVSGLECDDRVNWLVGRREGGVHLWWDWWWMI